jgi:hypothetical protein
METGAESEELDARGAEFTRDGGRISAKMKRCRALSRRDKTKLAWQELPGLEFGHFGMLVTASFCPEKG